ncbi:hypothetical protein E4U21_006145 [Claviceps maximensis]|nr:hypothetical protein E4U21_006145 [Claviceps maximensis]
MRVPASIFLLAAAVCSAIVLPKPVLVDAQPALHAENLESRAVSDQGGMEMDLYRRQKWIGCLFNFPLFHVNQDNRISFQAAIDNRQDVTYNLPNSLDVRILADQTGEDRHIGIEITNWNLHMGSIVLSNYQDTRSTTTARETIQVDYNGFTTRTCIRLPRLDGTWYVQRST